jgi:hypothetical protein
MALKPEVIHLPYGTAKHTRVLEAVRQRKLMSQFYMKDRWATWARMEERFRAYVNKTENDNRREQLKKVGKPQYVTIEIPYSYAMLLTAHTYWTSVFLSRNPILQFQARDGKNTTNEQAVESLIDYQVQASGMLLPLYLWFMDAGKYGLGVLGNSWFEDYRTKTEIVEVDRTYLGMNIGGKKKVRQTQLYPVYKGNRIFNIRPQDFFPDPRVQMHRVQEGEFCGRIIENGWNTVKRREADGWYYNIDDLQKNLKTTRDWVRDAGSTQLILPPAMDTLYHRGMVDDPANDEKGNKQKSYVETLEMTIEIIPRDWELGSSTYPEKYAFTVANDTVILNAMPTGRDHQKYEYFTLEYEIESYALNKRSMLEIAEPLNDVLSWLFNSHMYNVRKAINDQLIVDPSRITMKDLTDPVSGRIIRLKPEAYGTPPSEAVHQLAVADITRPHMQDFGIVAELLQRVLGVNENMMGMVNQGGRKTATEVRTSSTLGINRLKTNCEYMSAMGFTPWAEVMLMNTQQMYDENQELRIAGRTLGGPQGVMVTPDSIAGKFDYIPVDGTMPIDRFAVANLWKELAGVMMKMPQVAQQYDWAGIMGWIAQLGGIKNLDQFRLQVVPNAGQQGGLPIQGAANNGGGTAGAVPTGGSTENGQPVPGAGAVSGVGRVA